MQIWEAREGWQEWQARTACKTRETWETRPVREACWQRVGATSANGLCVVVRHPRENRSTSRESMRKGDWKNPLIHSGQNISAANWIRILTIHPYISWLPVTQNLQKQRGGPQNMGGISRGWQASSFNRSQGRLSELRNVRNSGSSCVSRSQFDYSIQKGDCDLFGLVFGLVRSDCTLEGQEHPEAQKAGVANPRWPLGQILHSYQGVAKGDVWGSVQPGQCHIVKDCKELLGEAWGRGPAPEFFRMRWRRARRWRGGRRRRRRTLLATLKT